MSETKYVAINEILSGNILMNRYPFEGGSIELEAVETLFLSTFEMQQEFYNPQ